MAPDRNADRPRRGSGGTDGRSAAKPSGGRQSPGGRPGDRRGSGRGAAPGKRPTTRGGTGGRSRSTGAPRRAARPKPEEPTVGRRWGSVARRGAGRVAGGPDATRDTRVWPGAKRDQERVERRAAPAGDDSPRRRDSAGEWVRDEALRGEADAAVRRGTQRGAPRHAEVEIDEGPAAALATAVGPRHAAKSVEALQAASRAFRRERFREAAKLLRPLAEQAPRVPAVRELYGLTLYRLGQWRKAAAELEVFAALTHSTEQHPVLADCARAMRRWDEVDRRWEELRQASPSAALVAEGRIVMAGALADRGRLGDAVRLLDRANRPVKKPKDHHLATAYALADLLERSGDLARARETFQWVASAAPDFADARRRAAALG